MAGEGGFVSAAHGIRAEAAVRRSRSLPGRDIPDAVRLPFVTVVLVLLTNHLWFSDLANRSLLSDPETGSLFTQALFVILGTAMLMVLGRLGFARLRPLASWPLLLLGGWLGITTLLSTDPMLSIRRIVLFGIVALLAAGVLVVARNGRQFATALALAAGIVLAASYLGVALVPNLTIHSAFDVTGEYNHIGLWRGIFTHKNEAGSAMSMIAVCGLYVAAVMHRGLGWTITAGALVFMVFAGSKTPLAVLPLVLLVSVLCSRLRGGTMRGLLLVGPVALLIVATIGSVLLPPIRTVLDAIIPDATFTARNEIWAFAIEHVVVHPIRGWGYGAFWLTDRTVYGGGADPGSDWVQTATQAHNSFLDAALIMGLPGALLLLNALVVAPIRDLQRASAGRPLDAQTLFFLRIWMLAVISASFENVLLNANTVLCGMTMLAVFGLRLRTAYRPVA
ncbi:O-antigen ligase family protein [Methylobacterium sp. WL30]|nr:O-antigen ligase family protein [Methylobacterium sp. WL93]TXN53112.1 O-antigen ligase family protein [Methylobacterium sp. WL119]TXN70875.1 O-antigen ligase family protein [Methylobacterium sp. WL30]